MAAVQPATMRPVLAAFPAAESTVAAAAAAARAASWAAARTAAATVAAASDVALAWATTSSATVSATEEAALLAPSTSGSSRRSDATVSIAVSADAATSTARVTASASIAAAARAAMSARDIAAASTAAAVARLALIATWSPPSPRPVPQERWRRPIARRFPHRERRQPPPPPRQGWSQRRHRPRRVTQPSAKLRHPLRSAGGRLDVSGSTQSNVRIVGSVPSLRRSRDWRRRVARRRG